MAAHDALDRYHRRRDFTRTAEPRGAEPGAPGDRPCFVVRIHDARTLIGDQLVRSTSPPAGPSR
ncbi:hypothetical protein AB0A71_15350 [Kitasatospora aureofaciens]|uniref:hypothetical protein n=1 Tax=Kitasatospora aureofaciens TaxID=1894 RepID=UPI00340F01BF